MFSSPFLRAKSLQVQGHAETDLSLCLSIHRSTIKGSKLPPAGWGGGGGNFTVLDCTLMRAQAQPYLAVIGQTIELSPVLLLCSLSPSRRDALANRPPALTTPGGQLLAQLGPAVPTLLFYFYFCPHSLLRVVLPLGCGDYFRGNFRAYAQIFYGQGYITCRSSPSFWNSFVGDVKTFPGCVTYCQLFEFRGHLL